MLKITYRVNAIILLFILIISCMIVTSVFADTKINGTSQLQSRSIDKIKVTGTVSLVDVTVREGIIVTGTVKVQNSKIHLSEDSKFVGTIELYDSELNGEILKLVGVLKTDNSEINTNAVIHSDYIELSATKAKEIIIKNPQKKKRQIVRVINNSTVESIIFESGNGVVQIDKSSRVKKVVGAKVQQL